MRGRERERYSSLGRGNEVRATVDLKRKALFSSTSRCTKIESLTSLGEAQALRQRQAERERERKRERLGCLRKPNMTGGASEMVFQKGASPRALGKKHYDGPDEYQAWDYLKGSGPAAPDVSIRFMRRRYHTPQY